MTNGDPTGGAAKKPPLIDGSETHAEGGAAEPLDLEGPNPQPPSTPAPPTTVKYDPAQDREGYRAVIALWLLALLTAVVVFAFLTLWFQPGEKEELKELLALLFGPVIALVGAATGYYFGDRAS